MTDINPLFAVEKVVEGKPYKYGDIVIVGKGRFAYKAKVLGYPVFNTTTKDYLYVEPLHYSWWERRISSLGERAEQVREDELQPYTENEEQ